MKYLFNLQPLSFKRPILLILALIGTSYGYGQLDTLELSGPVLSSISLDSISQVYLDTTRRLKIEDYESMNFTPHAKEMVPNEMQAQQYKFWQQFVITNHSGKPISTFLRSRVFKNNQVFELIKDKTLLIGDFGLSIPKRSWPVPLTYELFPLTIAPNESRHIIIQSYENQEIYSYYPNIELNSVQHTSEALIEEQHDARWAITSTSIFLGIFSFLAVFMTLQYFQNRNKSYLFYSLYLVSAVLFFNGIIEVYPSYNYFYSHIPWFFLKFPFISYILLSLYLIFTKHFLDLKNELPRLNTIISNIIKFIYAAFTIYVILNTFDWFPLLRYQLLYSFLFAMEAINIFIFTYILIFYKGKIKVYYCTGYFFLILGSTLFLVMSSKYNSEETPNSNPMFFTQFGILLESILFAAGLGYKSKLVNVEAQEAKINYINQLKRNNELQLKQNIELEEQVKARSKELLDVQSEILRAEYEGQIMELDSKILLSQMNPHFLFNSLSSIKQYVINNPTQETTQYIGEFASLVRMILQYSRRRWISLSEELEFLTLYAGLEQKRFASEIELEISNNSKLLLEEIELPPMILQPIVENAILHGLRTVKHKGLIKISVLSNSEHIIVEVIDNGIGRNAALKLRPSYKNEKPLGTTITLERIEMLNKLYNTNFNMEIIDLYTDNKATGTKVVLTFPK